MRWRIFHREVTESTNLDARGGVPGDVFTADFQTAGRGRLDHRWLSAPGENLAMSAVLDVGGQSPQKRGLSPDNRGLYPEEIATLPLVVGLAVAEALAPFAVPTRLWLKWPNDVLADGGRKLAGILCERHGDSVIAGIGINVNQAKISPEIEKRAISLVLLRGQSPNNGGLSPVARPNNGGLSPVGNGGLSPVGNGGLSPENKGLSPENKGLSPCDGRRGRIEVASVRDAVLATLSERVALWRRQGFAAIHPFVATLDCLKGREVSVAQTDCDGSPVSGLCGGIAPDGSLIVAGRRIYAGEARRVR